MSHLTCSSLHTCTHLLFPNYQMSYAFSHFILLYLCVLIYLLFYFFSKLSISYILYIHIHTSSLPYFQTSHPLHFWISFLFFKFIFIIILNHPISRIIYIHILYTSLPPCLQTSHPFHLFFSFSFIFFLSLMYIYIFYIYSSHILFYLYVMIINEPFIIKWITKCILYIIFYDRMH